MGPHAKLSLFFSKTLREMPQLIQERKDRRNISGKKTKKPKKGQEEKQYHEIQGREQLAVLFEELYSAMPGGLYKSPLTMIMSLLDREKVLAEEQAAKATKSLKLRALSPRPNAGLSPRPA